MAVKNRVKEVPLIRVCCWHSCLVPPYLSSDPSFLLLHGKIKPASGDGYHLRIYCCRQHVDSYSRDGASEGKVRTEDGWKRRGRSRVIGLKRSANAASSLVSFLFLPFIVNLEHPASLLATSSLSFSPQSTFRPLSPSWVPYPCHPTLNSFASHSAPLVWHVWRMNIREEHLKVVGQKSSPWDSSFGLGGLFGCLVFTNGHLWKGSSCYHKQLFVSTMGYTKQFDFNYLTLVLKCNQTKNYQSITLEVQIVLDSSKGCACRRDCTHRCIHTMDPAADKGGPIWRGCLCVHFCVCYKVQCISFAVHP